MNVNIEYDKVIFLVGFYDMPETYRLGLNDAVAVINHWNSGYCKPFTAVALFNSWTGYGILRPSLTGDYEIKVMNSLEPYFREFVQNKRINRHIDAILCSED